MRNIKIEELKAANRTAFLNNKLAFQSSTPECTYETTDGCRCSIGIALTSDELQSIGSMRMLADELVRCGIVGFESVKFALELQDTHDQIARARIMEEPDENRLKYFKRLIGLKD